MSAGAEVIDRDLVVAEAIRVREIQGKATVPEDVESEFDEMIAEGWLATRERKCLVLVRGGKK